MKDLVKDIVVYDHHQGKLIQEKVYGGRWLNFFYQNAPLRHLISQKSIQVLSSRVLGFWKHLPFSRRGIQKFVKDYGISMEEFVQPTHGYRSFNDFFIRQFKKGLRNFPKLPGELGAMAEGRLSVFKIENTSLPLKIKGVEQSLATLLGSKELAKEFLGGWLFVFRLCPVDYHRFHFFDNGVASDSTLIQGALHSVNPVAQSEVPEVFLLNERRVCVFESENFGKALILEIGALGVGRIVQSYPSGMQITRGQEKGYFCFGGSTTVLLLKKNQIEPLPELIAKNQEGFEVLVRLGQVIGHRP